MRLGGPMVTGGHLCLARKIANLPKNGAVWKEPWAYGTTFEPLVFMYNKTAHSRRRPFPQSAHGRTLVRPGDEGRGRRSSNGKVTTLRFRPVRVGLMLNVYDAVNAAGLFSTGPAPFLGAEGA